MLTVPVDIPATTPAELTVPTVALLLLHTPPGELSVKITVSPGQTLSIPEITPAEGGISTVMAVVAMQPVGNEYVMTVVPVATPLDTPVALPIVATAVFELTHVPPVDASLSVPLAPVQISVGPVMAAGSGFTVTFVVTEHPVAREYVICVIPAEMPDTMPDDEPMVAIEGPELDHDPPAVISVSGNVAPAHRPAAPPIGAGSGFTVMVRVV